MALVVRDDGAENDTLPKADAVVLDALPYVEPLDPDYEQYAISLIEEELQHTLNERAKEPSAVNTNGEIEDHPSLRSMLPSSLSGRGSCSGGDDAPDFGGKAPYAAAAYKSIAARREANQDRTTSMVDSDMEWMTRPDPIAQNRGNINDGGDEKAIISDMNTSIATSKIKLEQERLHLVNLELYQQFESSRRWMDYHSQLESHYVTPMSDAVARQRLKVDGINAGRMEEQEIAARKIRGLTGRFDQLVDKNHRLGKAIAGLEAEVEGLRQVVGVESMQGKSCSMG
mmetsp:Transcript_23525/g.46896  ORF Transcript_23525/g.46896 Transcript_23525/m.46896 type:complete len:285 (+) Transcript_23525:174-1028(+)